MSAADDGRSGRSGKTGGADDTLWDAIKKTVKPLRRQTLPGAAAPPGGKAAPRALKQKTALRAMPPPAPPRTKLPPLADLDRRARSRIARGSIGIEGRLDLHGYQQAAAKERLRRFLHEAQSREQSLVLVITGKGTVASPDGERGVLKRQVPLWLAQPEFRALVIGFEAAAASHGGGGALYVRVRRRR